MKIKLIILISLIWFPALNALPGEHHREKDSAVTGFIDIVVESNVNKVYFSYPLSGVNLKEENYYSSGSDETSIVVPVRDFRCDNKIARKDFLELLKADKYPELSIRIPGGILEQLRFRKSVTLHDVAINIAGVTRAYDITCRQEDNGTNGKILVGTITVPLTDLNIDPPVKYFGMVRIKNEVIVKFGLGIKDQSYARK